eukprot:GHRR01015147.1.p2 GENE.GHRR01015147.1~~GHRR01015147.1.p2  ORF type:complete len:101 (+),score=24.22 GHRR01015147.1:424-726(+)
MNSEGVQCAAAEARATEGYKHRVGTKEYMQATVMSQLQPALEALVLKVQQDRLQLAAGIGLEDREYLPHGWRPFCPTRWLAEHLTSNKTPASQQKTAADD